MLITLSIDNLVKSYVTNNKFKYINTELFFEKIYLYFLDKEEPCNYFTYEETGKCKCCNKNKKYTLITKFAEENVVYFDDFINYCLNKKFFEKQNNDFQNALNEIITPKKPTQNIVTITQINVEFIDYVKLNLIIK